MTLAFYFDEDMSRHAVAVALRERGVDVLTALEADNRGMSDEWQLGYALQTGRVLYTANQRDFTRLHAEWHARRFSHAGILVLSRQLLPAGDQIRALLAVNQGLDSPAMESRLEFLSSWVRRT